MNVRNLKEATKRIYNWVVDKIKERKLIQIIIMQFIVIIIFLSIIFLLVFEEDTSQEDNIENNITVDVDWIGAGRSHYSNWAIINIQINNDKKGKTIGPNTISYEAISKDLNGTELDTDIGYVDETIFPGDFWSEEVHLTVPGNRSYAPGYKLEIYVFFNGNLIHSDSKTVQDESNP